MEKYRISAKTVPIHFTYWLKYRGGKNYGI